MSTPTRARKSGPRERLIAAAERLFYAEGIHAVGVDRLCAEAEVSKRSLYQHFAGKDEVVTVMLEAKAAETLALLAPSNTPPRQRILSIFEQLDAASGSSEFHGCPFVSAATELKDRDHPAVRVAQAEKLALTRYFADALREGGAADPESVAWQLTLLFDGASAYALVHGESTPATRQAVTTILGASGL